MGPILCTFQFFFFFFQFLILTVLPQGPPLRADTGHPIHQSLTLHRSLQWVKSGSWLNTKGL